jgi:hypothetical protein
MSDTLDGYYFNGARSAIAHVEEQQRRSRRRLETLEQQNHPSAPGQRRWIEIHDQWLAILKGELKQ